MPYKEHMEVMSLWASEIDTVYKRKTKKTAYTFDAYGKYKLSKALAFFNVTDFLSFSDMRRRAADLEVDYFDLKKYKCWVPNLLVNTLETYSVSVQLHNGIILYNCQKEDVSGLKKYMKEHHPDVPIIKCLYKHESLRNKTPIPSGFDFLLGLQSPRAMRRSANEIVGWVMD